jgi:hypothetical protein
VKTGNIRGKLHAPGQPWSTFEITVDLPIEELTITTITRSAFELDRRFKAGIILYANFNLSGQSAPLAVCPHANSYKR